MPRLRSATDELGPLPVVFFALVVVAAGVSGVALLVAPGATHRYFSWTLRPPGAAALIGGFYVASAVIFAWALTLPRRQVRPLMTGVLGLALPTLLLSLVYDEVFDFGRWQAVAWMALFVAAPISAATILWTMRVDPAPSSSLRGWWRGLLGALAAALALLGVLVWVDATRPAVAGASPVALVRLTGTYLGAWCSFLAALCSRAAFGGGWDDARVALATLAAVAGGAVLALIRTIGDIRRPGLSLSVCVALLGLATWGYVVNRPSAGAKARAS